MNNESHLSTVMIALVSSVVYTFSPACYIATLALAIPWFLLCSMASAIALSFLAAHRLEDNNIVVFQFIYWYISWSWLGWKISPSLPAFLANSIMFMIIALILIIVFADTLFFTIVSSTGGTLGRYGTIHAIFWERMELWWDCSLLMRDAVVRALGPRRVVTECEGEQSRVAIVPSPVETEASSPPPQYCHIADFQQFPPSLVKSSLSMAEIIA